MTREQLLIERVRDLKAVGAKHEHLAKIVADQYSKLMLLFANPYSPDMLTSSIVFLMSHHQTDNIPTAKSLYMISVNNSNKKGPTEAEP